MIFRHMLRRDLKDRYINIKEVIRYKLHKYIKAGGKISLTTDNQAGNNKLDYIAIINHFIKKNNIQRSIILDIIKLTNPIYNNEYLCKKLIEVTNRLRITCAILSITRDNTASNDTILAAFKQKVKA